MIEQLDIAALMAVVDNPAVAGAMPEHGSRAARQEELTARCLWLRGNAGRLAIWRPGFAGEYRAILFDIEQEPVEFVAAVLDHMFLAAEARQLTFSTLSEGAGAPFRARYVGPFHGRQGHSWSLDRADWLKRAAR